MTVRNLITALRLEPLVEGDLDRAVTGGYSGDLLSWVMGRAKAGDAWFSVMGNVNAVAVCVLADVACLVLCENATLDDAARARAELENVTILRSTDTAYMLSGKLAALLEKPV